MYGLLLMRRERLPRGFWRKLFLSLAGGIFLGFLPTLIWNMQNNFQVGMATPWWLLFMFIGGFAALAFVLKGKGRNLMNLNHRQSALLSVFFLPVWIFFFLWSFHAKVLGNWAVISYVSGVMIAGFAFESFWGRKGRFRSLWMSLSIVIF
ncbi:glycosyltransferase family 39 protein, partial [Aduncisulcus paluster]